MNFTDPLFALSADPHAATSHFAHFVANYKKNITDDTATRNFVKIFGNSRFLSRHACNNPAVFDTYRVSIYRDQLKPLTVFYDEVSQRCQNQTDLPSLFKTLKRYKYEELMRLTIKELQASHAHHTYIELSFLCRAIVTQAVKFMERHLQEKYNIPTQKISAYTLLAMGKLGGNELNYSSDIDLVGFYNADEDYTYISSHEFFVKLFAELGNQLSLADENGFLFRTDWDLRPEGRSGTLANSASAAEYYYENFGALWERQAFIKASPVYQTDNFADSLITMLIPFVYRKTFDERTIKEVWDMKSRIVNDVLKKNRDGIDIKLGKGGIRTIEFFVQGFQLLYGGKIPSIRTPNTLVAIEKLFEKNLIKKDAAALLTNSYLFLRRLESCLQMADEQQTHVYKNNAAHKVRVARRMGLTVNSNDAAAQLDLTLHNTLKTVQKLFEEVYNK